MADEPEWTVNSVTNRLPEWLLSVAAKRTTCNIIFFGVMASPVPDRKALICEEKQRVTECFLQAVRELAELHSREMSLIVDGANADRFDMR